MNNKFTITITCRNVEDWIETNLNSVLCQTYPNWEVMYIDDASDDNTGELYHQIVGDNPKFKYIRNPERLITSRIDHMKTIEDPETIIVALDGDDWLATENVLEQYNEFYNKHDTWVTWGKMVVWDGDENCREAEPQNTPYPQIIEKYALYRRNLWRASHLRTYRNFLWKQVQRKSLQSKITGKDFTHASDLCEMFPLLEMAPLGKAKPVDFISVVWNAHPSKMNLTREREKDTKENESFEMEVRMQPRYKRASSREDLKSETLPCINIFGDFCERHSILTKATYVYGADPQWEQDVSIFHDANILKYLSGEVKITHGKVVAQVIENPGLWSQAEVYKAVDENADKFDLILAWHEDLLKHPNARHFTSFEISQWSMLPEKELDESWFQIYPKSKMTSFVASGKAFSQGHAFRKSCFDYMRQNYGNDIHFFGRDFKPIKSKIEALKDYRFSIAMENSRFNNYFTEKILDCFLAGTIPIYRGPENIGDFFDINGILVFDTLDELVEIVNNLDEKTYHDKMDSVKKNYEIASEMWINNDRYFEKYIKPIL